jgi:glycosyltransferase involved in cell wall biosynthesis
MEMKISAVVIAKNEELMLPDCLKSLTFADEILVVDTGSIDKTIEIAKTNKAKVIKYSKGKNYSDWRNKGLAEAKGEWIFYVDADERVTRALRKEILSVVATPSRMTGVYAVPRRNIILGKEFRHGGFYPDYQKRLFKKSALRKWTGEVHEEPVFEGQLEHLKNPLVHDKHETIFEMVEKTNKWSAIEAKLMFDAGHPPMNVLRFISALAREFWKRMIIGRAFLDGKVGVIFAIYQVFSRFVSYAKLWEMQVKKGHA